MPTRRARLGQFVAPRFVPCGVALALLACSPRAAPAATPPPNESQNIAQPAMPEPQPVAPAPPAAAAAVPSNGLLYDVGALPPELDLHWPTAPFTPNEAKAATLDQFAKVAAGSGTHVNVTSSLMGDVLIKGSDITITMNDGVEIQRLAIDHGCKRVMLKGGKYGSILLALPAEYAPEKTARPDWMIEDVIIDGVEVHSSEIAFEVYGKRIAIVRSKAQARTYSVWSGPALGLGSEDIVIAGNHLDSSGPEATVRLVSVVRSVTVDNVLRNTAKHNYRVHGESDLAYAARNTLINTGAMLGTMDDDHINKLWFDNNTFFQQVPDLFNPSATRIGYLHAEGNTAYSDKHDCFVCRPAAGWRTDSNKVLPYKPPPALR